MLFSSGQVTAKHNKIGTNRETGPSQRKKAKSSETDHEEMEMQDEREYVKLTQDCRDYTPIQINFKKETKALKTLR